ncbi:MAG: hypothetical protein RJA99_1208 [Pseudomonadota bacterium]|jgi:hypothetical protein
MEAARARRMPPGRAGHALRVAVRWASALGFGLVVATGAATERTRTSVLAVTATVPPPTCSPTNADRSCTAVQSLPVQGVPLAPQDWPGPTAVSARTTSEGLMVVTVTY